MRDSALWSTSASARATTPALTYVLAIAITTILISGLLISSSGLVDDRRQGTVREELEIIGERLSASVSALDAASDGGGTVSRRIEVPATVLDTEYYVDVVSCGAGSGTCIQLRTGDPELEVTVTVPVDNRSTITVDRSRPRSVTISASAGADRPPGADADVTVAPNIGVAEGVNPSLSSGGSTLGSSQALVVSGFDYGPAPPALSEQIRFTADVGGSGTGNLTYTWDFGDGDTVVGNETTAATATHNYSDPGRYPVELTVEDAAGANDSVTRLLRVSGLVFEGDKEVTDPDGDGTNATVSFDIRNNFASDEIRITEVLIEPKNSDIDQLDDGLSTEIFVDGTSVYDRSGVLRIEDSGSIADFGSGVTLASGQQTTVTMSKFRDSDGNQFDMTDRNVTVAFRYEIEGTDRNYVSEFDINTGAGDGGGGGVDPGDSPVIEEATPEQVEGFWGTEYLSSVELELSDANGDLSSVEVEVLDDEGNVIGSRSADLSPYDDRAEGELSLLGYYSGDAAEIHVILRDENGNQDTRTETVS